MSGEDVSPWVRLLEGLQEYQRLPTPGAPLAEWDCSADFVTVPSEFEGGEDRRLWVPSVSVPERWQTLLFSSGRGSGKALDVATPVLTANRGWVTVGDVVVGDRLFDERGVPTTVTAVYQPTPERVFDVTFSTGETVRACGDHLWTVMNALGRKRWNRRGGGFYPEDWATSSVVDTETVSTVEMFERQKYGSRGDRNFSIPLAQPLDYGSDDAVDFSGSLSPWLLGFWLGNGCGAVVSCHSADEAEVKERFGAMFDVTVCRKTASREKASPNGSNLYVGGLLPVLEADGLRGVGSRGKAVPPHLLRGSFAQRLGLLRGLCDSDGYVNPTTGMVEFCSSSERLARDVHWLAVSLGERPTIKRSTATLYGRDMGDKWRVLWSPVRVNPFVLARKSRKVNMGVGAQASRRVQRMITSVTETDARPSMRCFTVDSPSSLFCVTESMIPTHNTFSGSCWVLLSCAFYALTAKPEETVNVFAIGPSWAHVIETMMFEGDSSIMGVAPEGLIDVKACSRNTATGRPTIVLNSEGRPGRITITGLSAETPEKWRGKEGQGAWWDEPAACQYAAACWRQLRQVLRKSEFPKALLSTTPDHLAPSKQLVWALDKAARGEPDSPLVLAELGGLVGPVVRRSVPSWENATMPLEWREAQKAAAESGSAWARQEILGELVDGVVEALIGADEVLWVPPPPPEGVRWVDIGVDPAVTSGRGDEFGLVAAAATRPKVVGHQCQAVLVEDSSGHMDANAAWARLGEMVRRWPVRKVFVETNQGGDFVLDGAKTAVQAAGGDPRVVQAAWSSKGKAFRAQPVAVAFRDKRLGVSESLRGGGLMKQWCTWQPEVDKKVSPDRIDASVAATFGMDFAKPQRKPQMRRAAIPGVDRRFRRH